MVAFRKAFTTMCWGFFFICVVPLVVLMCVLCDCMSNTAPTTMTRPYGVRFAPMCVKTIVLKSLSRSVEFCVCLVVAFAAIVWSHG